MSNLFSPEPWPAATGDFHTPILAGFVLAQAQVETRRAGRAARVVAVSTVHVEPDAGPLFHRAGGRVVEAGRARRLGRRGRSRQRTDAGPVRQLVLLAGSR